MHTFLKFFGIQRPSCLIVMVMAQGSDCESKGDKLYSSVDSKLVVSGTHSSADEIPAHKPTGLSRIKLKNMHITHDNTNLRSWEGHSKYWEGHSK